MASPQLENGYLKIANEIWEALCGIRIPGETRQVLDVIIRKTYGYNKKEDFISYGQIQKYTGIKRCKIPLHIKKLLDMKLIFKIADGHINKYGFNKNYDEWQCVTKNGNRVFPKKETEMFPKGGTTKNNKYSIKKNINIHPLQQLVLRKFPRVSKMEQQLSQEDCEILETQYDPEDIERELGNMENWKPLLSSKVSVYNTLAQWLTRNQVRRRDRVVV